ncbi:hypothetical protein HPB47_008906 [Ixodes persulcatus]|uniref:Uncharacterized protein n=1 Tax=Ixodes persulcatus TaxID=34615 RepID=A0AC60P3R3_IXOPE|nr:hypothetical protein HPB47_008906 [Ixodes persulcatus]
MLVIVQDYKYKVVIQPRNSFNLSDPENELGGAILGALRSPPQNPVKFKPLYDQNILIACTNNMNDAFGFKSVKQLRISGQDLDVQAYLTQPRETTCTGIIRGIKLQFNEREISEHTYGWGY